MVTITDKNTDALTQRLRKNTRKYNDLRKVRLIAACMVAMPFHRSVRETS